MARCRRTIALSKEDSPMQPPTMRQSTLPVLYWPRTSCWRIQPLPRTQMETTTRAKDLHANSQHAVLALQPSTFGKKQSLALITVSSLLAADSQPSAIVPIRHLRIRASFKTLCGSWRGWRSEVGLCRRRHMGEPKTLVREEQ